MILTGPEILRNVRKGDIRIDPFAEELLNPASVDVRLGGRFFEYDAGVLDASTENPGKETTYTDGDAVVLHPGRLYLAHTLERIYSSRAVPIVDGKSSIGRLGVSVHQTAGYGDAGFDGQYTLEVTVVHPVRLRVGMRIAQMRFHVSVGEFATYKGRYVGEAAMGPVPSRLFVPASTLPASANGTQVLALPPASAPANPHDDHRLSRGKLVNVRFKTGTGKEEKVNNGEGLVLNVTEKYLRVRVWGGTANANPEIDVVRASSDWSLRYP